MIRRDIVLVAQTSILLAWSGQSRAEVLKPNFIVILTDDMGQGDLVCYGGKIAPTPNIDRLAAEGIQFMQYYSASPISSPSRTGIITGTHPATWNITSYLQTRKGNRECQQADFLNHKAPSIARTLKNAGYATGHFGKWHMGGGRDVKDAPGIAEYGFDEYSSTWESPDPDHLLTSSNWIWAGTDSIKRWRRSEYFVDKTLDFLKRHRSQPCYINLWPDDVHTPWVPDQERFGMYPKGTSELADLQMVLSEYDRQIGRLIDGLKQLGIDNNTIVIFTSDNGALPAFNGSRTGGFRGSKLSLYEGGIRMPFIVRWPAAGIRGVIDRESVLSAYDIFPTLCAIAGAELPEGYSFSGKDKSSAIRGKPSSEKRTIYWEYGRNNTSFSYPEGIDRSPTMALREGKWKLLMNSDGSDIQLFNIDEDISESKNASGQFPGIAAKMRKKLERWWNDLPKLD